MKIRMDFVTNSSSSSFVAFGILSSELTELIRKLVNGKEVAYSKWCVGEIQTDTFNGEITVVTTMDFWDDYHIYNCDVYDNRTDKQKERDDKKANTEKNIIKKVDLFLPTLTAEETTKINQLIHDAVASGKTVASTYISETDGYSYPYFTVNDFIKMQDKKASAKWLAEFLEKADAIYTEPANKPETLKRFVRGLNISERTLVALIQKVYSKNAEEWLYENKYIIGKEEKLVMLLKQADENFEKSGKRPDSIKQFISENGSRKYIFDLIMSVHNIQAEEWLIENGYIVCASDEEKLSEYLKRADDDYKVNGKRPENLTQFLKVANGTVYTVPKLIRAVHNCSPEEWLRNNGYIVPMTGEDKLAELLAELKRRYPEGSELLSEVKDIQKQNSDLQWVDVTRYAGTNTKDWLITNGVLASRDDVRKAKKEAHQKEVESKEAERIAKHKAYIEEMKKVEKRDESILSAAEVKQLNNTLQKLNQYYPEYKTYSMDALCGSTRDSAVKLSSKLGYNTVDEFLYVYGYEPIIGKEVYELRKNCGYIPGNEPELVKSRVDNTIAKLEEFYPEYIIEGAVQRKSSSLSDTISGLYQWLGYESSEDFLFAYGFVYIVNAGLKQTFNSNEVVFELLKRYPDGTQTKALQLVDENPDLPMMLVYKNSNRDFGMSLQKYLEHAGVILSKKISVEEARAKREAEAEKIADILADEANEKAAEEERIAKLVEIAKANREAYKQRKNQKVVPPTTKVAPNQPKEKMTPANDEATLQKYSDILESRKGTYPKDNISFEALKFFNKDIPWNTLNRITLNLFNEKIREYCVRRGFIN